MDDIEEYIHRLYGGLLIQERSVKQLDKQETKKLRVLHQKLFNNRIYLYEDDDLIYTCTYGSSNKYIFMCQILYNSPGIHFDNELSDEKIDSSNKQPYIIDFGLIPKYRRRGIGSYMMKYIINDIKTTAQYKYINLDILSDKKQSDDGKYIPIDISDLLLFYTKLGFKAVGKKWYHPDRRQRFVSMTLKIE